MNLYRNNKRLLGLFLAGTMVLSSVAGCATKDETKQTETETYAVTTTVEAVKDTTLAPTEEVTEAPTEKPTVEPTVAPTEPATEAEDTVNTADYITIAPLKDVYKDMFLIGTIHTFSTTTANGTKLVEEHFNVLTPENCMKPDATQPKEGIFSYTQGDAVIKFGQAHNTAVVGHNLCWHQQSGAFLGRGTREEAIEQLRNHIYNVAGHFKGQVISWDVVNEAIADGTSLPADGDWTKCLRKSQWYNSIGPDYLELAFQFAHEADPDAKLYYNDYNMNDKNKATIAAAMIKDFKARGIPIDGIGMQGHYSTDTSIGSVEYALGLFAEIPDLEISVTELDVTVNAAKGNKSLTKEQEIAQALMYAKLFNLYKKYSDKIVRITFWGTIDSASWRSEQFPCLFNKDYSPKEALYAVVDPEKYLELHAVGYGGNVRKANVTYGTPDIENINDPLWSTATSLNIDSMLTAWNGATGTAQVLWDENYLYVKVRVKDDYLNASSPNAYEQDSVEIFVDQNHGKTAFYEEDDGQFRVNYDGEVSFGSNAEELNQKFKSSAKRIVGGYFVMMAIPWVVNVGENSVIGFEAQINDAGAGGSRDSVAKYCDMTDNSWQTTENYGELTLIK